MALMVRVSRRGPGPPAGAERQAERSPVARLRAALDPIEPNSAVM